jgi:hypothetical protein
MTRLTERTAESSTAGRFTEAHVPLALFELFGHSEITKDAAISTLDRVDSTPLLWRFCLHKCRGYSPPHTCKATKHDLCNCYGQSKAIFSGWHKAILQLLYPRFPYLEVNILHIIELDIGKRVNKRKKTQKIHMDHDAPHY